MAKIRLTDRKLQTLKPAKAGQRYNLADSDVRGLGVRVTDKRTVTFVLVARFPGSINPTRRAIGEYPTISLADARETARDWLKLVGQGKDPRQEIARQQAAEARRRANTFAAVVADFIQDKLAGERRGHEVELDLRREFLPRWERRPISEITDLDVLTVIKEKRRAHPTQARNLLALAKRLFAWAVDQRCYGLAASPVANLKASKVVGDKVVRDRILSDAELVALWRAAKRLHYPYGPAYQMLILTGLRLNEVADATRSELDPANEVWTIPASRMKGRNGKARPHVVPLTDDILAVLAKLPRFMTGDFLFSTNSGKSPVWMSHKVMKRVDARMLRTLRALARRRGDDPAKVEIARWTNHETVRSGLSRLKISEEAREAVLAHARPGIKGVYDWHDYLDEKREALELWAARLRSIVEPVPTNVVMLKNVG